LALGGLPPGPARLLHDVAEGRVQKESPADANDIDVGREAGPVPSAERDLKEKGNN